MGFPCYPNGIDLGTNPSIHECFGFNLLDNVYDYLPLDLNRTPTMVFDSTTALQSQIDSQTDHGNAVYQLAGGTYTDEITLENVRNITLYSDISNRAIIDGQNSNNFGIRGRVTDGNTYENVNVLGFEVIDTRFHGIFWGGDGANDRAPRGSLIAGNKVHDCANDVGAGITIRNARNGTLIDVSENEVYNVSLGSSASGTGEGVYIGYGLDDNYYSENIALTGNSLHDLIGEAIDIKRNSRRIVIDHNDIYRISVASQGAITIGLDNNQTTQSFDAAISLFNNCIRDVTTREFNGNFITVGMGGVQIFENIMVNCAADGIDIYNDCDGSQKAVSVDYNIIWGYNGLPVRENVNTGNGSPNNPCTVTRSRNIVQTNAVNDECAEDASIFEGPLDRCSGFAPAA